MDISDLAYLLIFLFFILGNAILPLLKKKREGAAPKPNTQPQPQPRQDTGDPFEEIFGELRELGRKKQPQSKTRNLDQETVTKQKAQRAETKSFEDFQLEREISRRKMAESAVEDDTKRMRVVELADESGHYHLDAREAIIHQAILERRF